MLGCRGAAMYSRDTLLRIVAVALLLYAILSAASSSARLKKLRAAEAGLRQQLATLEQERDQLEQRLAEGISDEELERLARERLGLALPGEKIFYFTDREG